MPHEPWPAATPAVRRARARARWHGAALATLFSLLTTQLMPTGMVGICAVLLASTAIGAVLGGTRARWVLPVAAFALATLFLVGIATPLAGTLASRLVREDTLEEADAIVFLSSGTSGEGRLDAYGTERLLGAIELLAEGWAPVIVRTELPPDSVSGARDVERLVRLSCPEAPVLAVGPVESTRDEAAAVARLVAERGWSRIILVTSPVHSARAAAVFEGVGLRVTSRPCPDRVAFRGEPSWPAIRLNVLRGWLHEEAGWVLYRARGWVG